MNLFLLLILLLCISLLTGCFKAKPTDVVSSFLTAIQEGDIETASMFVEDSEEFSLEKLYSNDDDTVGTDVLLQGMSNGYKFDEPELLETQGDTAKVQVNITSIDLAVVFTNVFSEVMPMAMGMAFSEDQEESDKAINTMMESSFKKHLTSETATMSTRTVVLTLKKDSTGEFKLLVDDEFTESIFANMNKLEEMFSESE